MDTLPEEKKLHLDFVWLSDKELNKLLNKIGGTKTPEMIERLNDYIGQIGEKKAAKKYVSHYYVILNWLRKDGQTNGQITGSKSQSVGRAGGRTSTQAADRAIARIRQRSTRPPVDIHQSGNVGCGTGIMGRQTIEVSTLEIKQIS